jgi:membrane protein implicated in regulation of membrane protease activity
MNLDWLPGLDLASGTFTVPLWVVGVAAALLVALVVIAVIRAGLNEFGSLVFRVAVIVIAVVFGWTYVNRTAERDRADERRALDQRAAELMGRAVTPGSAIACLEATNTETVEGACERAVFATPETVAAATAYVSARLSLLSDAHDYTSRRDQGYESAIAGLRRTIAADRYGLASQVLATRDGCTADACDAFSLVYDDKKLRANLKDRLFDITVARYAVSWPTRTRPLASSAPGSGPVTPPGPNVTFPSAQSIPPVSIMNAEPPQAAAAPPPAQAAAPAPEPRPTNSAPASAARRPAAKKSSDSAAPLSLNPNAK